MNEQVPAPEIGKRRKGLVWVVVILGVVVVIGFTKYALHMPRGQDVDLITGFDQKTRLLPPSQYDLAIVLATNYHEYRDNSSRWSLAYYGCLFLSAFLSAMAALILKLEYFPKRLDVKKDLSATCATIAAVLITLSTVGNFQQKWQANRLAATDMQNLVYEVWEKGSGCGSEADIYSRIEEINLRRNQGIVGGDSATRGKDRQTTSEKPPVKNQSKEAVKGK